MSSRPTRDRLINSAKISKYGSPQEIPCDICHSINSPCLKMSPDKKCAECSRRGRPCVQTSWEALDKAREDLSKEINEDEKRREELIEQLSMLQARLERKRKVRKQAEERAKAKMECLIREMEESGELELEEPETAASDRSVPDSFALENLGDLEVDLGFSGVTSPFSWVNTG